MSPRWGWINPARFRLKRHVAPMGLDKYCSFQAQEKCRPDGAFCILFVSSDTAISPRWSWMSAWFFLAEIIPSC
jgi:hypothetical protein